MKEDIKKIIYSLHPLERKVLGRISYGNIADIASNSKVSETEVMTGLQLLEQKGYVQIDEKEELYVGLDKFGEKYADSDLPEVKLLKEIVDGPKNMNELNLEKDEITGAMGVLKRAGLLDIEKGEKGLKFIAKEGVAEYLKNCKNPLAEFKTDKKKNDLSNEMIDIFNSFKMRKGFLKEYTKKSVNFKVTELGSKVAEEMNMKYPNLELIETMDADMMKTGSWKGKEFRHYDTSVNVPIVQMGRRHPMLEANNILRDVFVEMGFKEMEGPMVESAFWNMDIMWIPQDHPARDEQDTFYLEESAEVPHELMMKVKDLHEEGIKRTHTPKGDWSEEVTKKRLLRTHSTATSFRTLSELGEKLKKGENIDGKYFYVANVFRNEAIDATHLAEFYQAEGFIIADDLSLADLMGFIKEYYAKLGIEQIRFKPTFNPYTEPSMEAHYYDKKMNKWYALINSGIFREETLKGFGLEKKRVIAWGMGASRVATLLSGKSSMRDITGATCDLQWLKTRPMMKRKIVR